MAVSVTVLMPMYNAAATVADAARSVLAEDVPGLELLVVDDGSSDGGAEVIERLGDRRVRIIRQPNSGLVGALNTGLEHARGEYLARMDADDLSVPGRIAAQLDWLRARPDAVVCGTDYEYFGAWRGRVRTPRSDRACRRQLYLTSCFCGAAVVLRRGALETAGLRFDPAYAHAEDYEFFTRLVALGQVGNLPTVGYRYRIHDRQVSREHAGAQRDAHRRTAAAYARRSGVPGPAGADLSALLWPEPGGGLRRTGAVAAAGARVWARVPGARTGRIVTRRVAETARGAIGG